MQAEHGALLDHELKDGLTALMVASREDQREAVKALLQLKAALPGWDEQMRQASRLDGWSTGGGGNRASACSWSFVQCVQGRVNSL